VQLDKNLSYTEHPIGIVDKEVRRLHLKDIVSVKDFWKGPSDEETTWELEEVMYEKYPHLFESRLVVFM
jgi:hypothetical protein